MQYYLTIPSPVGELTLSSDGELLTGVEFGGHEDGLPCPVLELAARQLEEYFSGRLFKFSLPIAPKGTEFQRRVWHCLEQIPYGSTLTYKELAKRAGSERAFRAVGQANRANPLPIIIPCHRVISSDGSLGGYMGQWNREGSPKEWLLRHEFSQLQNGPGLGII